MENVVEMLFELLSAGTAQAFVPFLCLAVGVKLTYIAPKLPIFGNNGILYVE